MRKLGFITNIEYIDNLNPSNKKIYITILDEAIDQVVTISPTNFERTYPYQLFQTVDYDKENDTIKLYYLEDASGLDLTKKELEFYQRSLLAIINDPNLKKIFHLQLLKYSALLSSSQNSKKH